MALGLTTFFSGTIIGFAGCIPTGRLSYSDSVPSRVVAGDVCVTGVILGGFGAFAIPFLVGAGGFSGGFLFGAGFFRVGVFRCVGFFAGDTVGCFGGLGGDFLVCFDFFAGGLDPCIVSLCSSSSSFPGNISSHIPHRIYQDVVAFDICEK